MLLTLHAATGAFVGELAPNPAFAFGLGVLSHFILDMFPHGDRMLAKRTKASGQPRRYFWLVGADALVGIAMFFPAFAFGRFEHPWLAYWGIIGGLLPDLIVAIPEYALYVKKEYRVRLRWFYRFHAFVHDQFIHVFDRVPLQVGLAFQLILFVIIWRAAVR